MTSTILDQFGANSGWLKTIHIVVLTYSSSLIITILNFMNILCSLKSTDSYSVTLKDNKGPFSERDLHFTKKWLPADLERHFCYFYECSPLSNCRGDQLPNCRYYFVHFNLLAPPPKFTEILEISTPSHLLPTPKLTKNR